MVRLRAISLAAALSLLCVPVLSPVAAAIDQAPVPARSATDWVRASITVVQRSLDLAAVRTMRLKIRTASSRLFDGDHPDAPYAIDYTDAVWTEDLTGQRRLITSTISQVTGDKFENIVLIEGAFLQLAIKSADKEFPRRALFAPQNWQLANPARALRLALAASDLRLSGTAVVHNAPTQIVGFTHRGRAVRLFLSQDNLLPLAVESLVNAPDQIGWASRGDLIDRTEWMNWNLMGGLRFPFQWNTSRNGEPIETVTIFEGQLDVELDEAAMRLDPEVAKQLALPGRADVDELPLGRPNQPIAEIAPGVIQIPGSWYTTLIRQPDGVVVIDGPISNGYSAKVIAEAERRFPGVPIKAVISTTSFLWHIAGLREYAARGIPIYALDRNRAVIEALMNAPHMLAPDKFSHSSRPPKVHYISAATTIGGGENRLDIIPLRRATGQMQMVYLPALRMLHTAEMVQPLGPGGSLLFPESLQEVTDQVKDAQIDPLTMIGMHMSPTPWIEVAKALAAPSP